MVLVRKLLLITVLAYQLIGDSALLLDFIESRRRGQNSTILSILRNEGMITGKEQAGNCC